MEDPEYSGGLSILLAPRQQRVGRHALNLETPPGSTAVSGRPRVDTLALRAYFERPSPGGEIGKRISLRG